MDKKKLSAIPKQEATADMAETALENKSLKHIVTADLHEKDLLILYFYSTADLKEGKKTAKLRMFFSKDDYITQDLTQSKTKWLTSCLYNLQGFNVYESHWNSEWKQYDRTVLAIIRSEEEKKMIKDFFSDYADSESNYDPWSIINRFQSSIMEARLTARRENELAYIDTIMKPVNDPPQKFLNWVWEKGMSFSRYLIYKDIGKGMAECECTHCRNVWKVSRKVFHLRHNETGSCPFCGSPVTFKARGKMAAEINDERWFAYVDSTKEGFILRYFFAKRTVRSDRYLEKHNEKERVLEFFCEYARDFFTFPEGKPKCEPFEWTVYKQRGKERWCPATGKIPCMECILYPENLPQAWEHTPMKYSALEMLSRNNPTTPALYEYAIKLYTDFPKFEWICKMGLNRLAKDLIGAIDECVGPNVAAINKKGTTIYEILGLNKINTRLLQEVDGNLDQLKLLQTAQEIGFQFKPEDLNDYYEIFGCNTKMLNFFYRRTSIHKIIKYITKESEKYPMKKCSTQWEYSHGIYTKCIKSDDPDLNRKKNMASDWLDYLDWCGKLGYDLNDMFYYMPSNFRSVHDRTMTEYQTMLDRQKAAERKREERKAKRHMKLTKEAMAEILKNNDGSDAFSIKGRGLILVVPETTDEIRAEGKALHHCVATYIPKIANGETNIFFIRKANNPEEPYFTMEYKNGHVEQCRGLRNCGMTPDVEAFVKVFEQKMQEQAKEWRKAG